MEPLTLACVVRCSQTFSSVLLHGENPISSFLGPSCFCTFDGAIKRGRFLEWRVSHNLEWNAIVHRLDKLARALSTTTASAFVSAVDLTEYLNATFSSYNDEKMVCAAVKESNGGGIMAASSSRDTAE